MHICRLNNTSGVTGVSFHKHTGKYQARVTIDGRRIGLGFYPTVEEAKRALIQVENKPIHPYSEFELDIAKRMGWTRRKARKEIATFQKAGIFLVTGDAPC